VIFTAARGRLASKCLEVGLPGLPVDVAVQPAQGSLARTLLVRLPLRLIHLVRLALTVENKDGMNKEIKVMLVDKWPKATKYYVDMKGKRQVTSSVVLVDPAKNLRSHTRDDMRKAAHAADSSSRINPFARMTTVDNIMRAAAAVTRSKAQKEMDEQAAKLAKEEANRERDRLNEEIIERKRLVDEKKRAEAIELKRREKEALQRRKQMTKKIGFVAAGAGSAGGKVKKNMVGNARYQTYRQYTARGGGKSGDQKGAQATAPGGLRLV
jgi:hypothetical protein